MTQLIFDKYHVYNKTYRIELINLVTTSIICYFTFHFKFGEKYCSYLKFNV